MSLFQAKEKTPLEAAKRAEKRCDDRCQGDRLMQSKRHARVATAKENVTAAIGAKSSAQKAHREAEGDDAFDPAPFDAEIAKWTAEVADRTAIAAAQDQVVAEGLGLRDAARKAVFIELRKELLAERQIKINEVRAVDKKVAELDAKIGDEPFALPAYAHEVFGNIGLAVATHVKPIAKVEPSSLPLNCIRIVRDSWSDGRSIYSRGEGVFVKSTELAAEAVASGHAQYQFVDDAQPRLVADAKRRLANADANRHVLSSAAGGNVDAA